MTIAYNPTVITNGLVSYMDAANTKSYGGSGTTSKDLITSSYNYTLQATPTYNSGTSFTFNGSSSYVQSASALNFNATLFPQGTVEVVFKPTVAGNSGTGYLIVDSVGGSPFWLGKDASNFWHWFYNWGSGKAWSASANATSFPANQWVHIAFRWSTTAVIDTGNFGEVIVNGTTFSTSHKNDAVAALGAPTTGFYIGKRGQSVFNGEIGATVDSFTSMDFGFIRAYNRTLSRDEVLKNFNATRGRFGL